MFTLLIADDEPLERETLELFVRQSKLPVVCEKVKNGREAVRSILHPKEGRHIDIVFLDIQMPLLNGLDAALEIHAAKPEMPIVFLTAWGTFDFAQQAIRVGAQDYLVKPVQKETVIAILEKIVARLKLDSVSGRDVLPETILKSDDILRGLRTILISQILESKTEEALQTADSVINACKNSPDTENRLAEFLLVLMRMVESRIIACDFSVPQTKIAVETASYLKSFIHHACEIILNERKNKYERFFVETRKYIDTNFATNIELSKLAKQINVTPYYFSKLFKSHTGSGFIEYVRAIRLNAAKQFLLQNETVSEAGKKVGYADTAYFSRIFKEEFGINPKEFKDRKAIMEEK